MDFPVIIDTEYKYGFHCKKFPTLTETVMDKINSPMNAMQIYISNGRSKAPPKINIKDILQAREIVQTYEIYLVIHGCLLYNMAGSVDGKSDPDYFKKVESTCKGLIAELDVGVGLGTGVVVHIGSSKDKKKGIDTIIDMCNHVLTEPSTNSKTISKAMNISEQEFISRRKVILENASGEGSKIGNTLQEIADIINGVKEKYPNLENLKDRLKVCIDTAHAFGAGIYDWGVTREINRFYQDFEELIGLDHLEVFHLNDSRKSELKGENAPFGSKKDRHENLGLGYIFGDGIGKEVGIPGLTRSDGLISFMISAREHQIPIIGEPPALKSGGKKEPAPGGKRDWGYVSNLLRESRYPLESKF